VSYEGGRLAPWFDTAPNRRFGIRAADRGGEYYTARVRERTPVDSGNLRDSIKQKPVTIRTDSRGRRVYESGAETDVEYGPSIEHGWGLWGPSHAKYLIKPRRPGGWLHWVDPHTGEDRFARRVMHPGAPGAHMFAVAAGVTEANFEAVVRAELLRWAVEVERQNKSDWGLGRGRL
jgi:hypothetical protein